MPWLIDMDDDGTPDEINIQFQLYDNEDHDDYNVSCTVTIQLSSQTEPFEYIIPECYDAIIAATECNPDNHKIDVLLCYNMSSDDYITVAFHINKENEIVTFEKDCSLYLWQNTPGDFLYHKDSGLIMGVRTDILGTTDVTTRFIVDDNGFQILWNEYQYPEWVDGWGNLTLKRDMEVAIIDCDDPGDIYTIPAGTVITPCYTDLNTYVVVTLPDGRIGQATLTFLNDENEWGIYINGINQDEYVDIHYAD